MTLPSEKKPRSFPLQNPREKQNSPLKVSENSTSKTFITFMIAMKTVAEVTSGFSKKPRSQHLLLQNIVYAPPF